MKPLRSRQLAGVAIAIAILMTAVAGWSQLRLRAMRGEIDALASETLELDTLNRALHDRLDSETTLRDELRSSAEAIELDPVRPDETMGASVFYDSTRNRALLLIEEPAPASSSAHTYRLLIEAGDGTVLSLPLGTAAVREDGLLLNDLPAGVKHFVIATDSGNGWQTVLSGRATTAR